MLEQYVPPRDNAYDGVYQGDVLRYGMKVRLYANAVSMGGALEDTGKAEGMCCAVGSEPASSGAQVRACLLKRDMV